MIPDLQHHIDDGSASASASASASGSGSGSGSGSQGVPSIHVANKLAVNRRKQAMHGDALLRAG